MTIRVENVVKVCGRELVMHTDGHTVYDKPFKVLERKIYKAESSRKKNKTGKVFREELHQLGVNSYAVYAEVYDFEKDEGCTVIVRAGIDLKLAKKDFSARGYFKRKAGFVETKDYEAKQLDVVAEAKGASNKNNVNDAEVKRKVEIENKKKEELERKKAEAEKRRKEEEVRKQAEAEAKKKEEAKKRKEAADRKKLEKEAKKKAEEAKKKAEEEAKKKAEEEAKKKAEEEKKKKEEEARKKAEEEKKKKEEEARKKAEEEAKKKAEEEAKKKALVQVTDAHGVKIIKRESLNFFDPAKNSNKFYIIELQELPTGGYKVNGSYGRVGARPQTFAEDFGSLEVADRKYESKLRAKLGKGYVKVDLATQNLGSNANRLTVNAAAIGGTVAKGGVSSLHQKVQQLVKQIYDEANRAVSVSLSGSVQSDIKAPLGNLSTSAIQKGKDILSNVAKAIKNNNQSDIEYWSQQYYRYIPRILPGNLRVDRSWVLGTDKKINDELDTLRLYEDSLRMLPAMLNTNVDSRYLAIGCDISYVDDPKVIKYVDDKVCKSIASNHHYGLQVVNVFEINQHNAPKLDDSVGNVRKLFHGSRSCNILGILSSHLKMPNSLPNVQKTGAMFGPGIYLASESSKSFNYSAGYWGNTKNKYDTAFLFIVETALGKIHKVKSAQYFMQPPAGYDSVQGCKGSSLYNDEFIVYQENRVRIKYLVEVKRI